MSLYSPVPHFEVQYPRKNQHLGVPISLTSVIHLNSGKILTESSFNARTLLPGTFRPRGAAPCGHRSSRQWKFFHQLSIIIQSIIQATVIMLLYSDRDGNFERGNFERVLSGSFYH